MKQTLKTLTLFAIGVAVGRVNWKIAREIKQLKEYDRFLTYLIQK